MAGFSSLSIAKFEGEWTFELAAHLLRRTMYGPQKEDIEHALTLGLDGTIAELLDVRPMPDDPINYSDELDPAVPLGESWVDKPLIRNDNVNQNVNRRRISLAGWTFGLALNEGMSIREKMTLFWHNHFVTSEVQDPQFAYDNIQLYRSNFLGNFRELTKMTTVDAAMLRYLNGNQNVNIRPNENYARELLELFTIGKGPIAGEGDYTNYTEQDVAEVAKVLTGWRDQGYLSRDGQIAGSFFRPFAHDTSTKTLSHRFGNAEIPDMGDEEYKHLIDIIFQQDEVANFITRKIYRWFVYYEIDDSIEESIIQPLAQILRDNDYDVQPMVEALLTSEHFFDVYALGSMIKSPYDFVTSQLKNLHVHLGDTLGEQYRLWFRFYNYTRILQMTYFEHPDVAGWKAYYQEPLFYRTWINETTISSRFVFTNLVLTGIRVDRLQLEAGVLTMIEDLETPEDPIAMIDGLAQILLPKPIDDAQKDYLKSILLPGLPDYEWTIEYNTYKANPEDEELKTSVENRLRDMCLALLSLPEYQLS